MIRLILTAIFLLIFFIISLVLFLFEYILGLFSRNLRDRTSYAIVQLAFKIIIFISGAKIIVKGFDNIPKNQSVLYVGNHRSFFDIVISYSMVPPLTGFVSKKEIKKVPILSTWMKLMNCLFLDRDNIKEGLKTILQGIEMVKSGTSIFIFPEGTRSHEDLVMRDFKEGSLKIAEKSGSPIIPVAFCNTSAIFEDHFPYIKKAKVIVEYGKPIYPKELDKENQKHLGVYTHDIIQDMVAKNHAELF